MPIQLTVKRNIKKKLCNLSKENNWKKKRNSTASWPDSWQSQTWQLPASQAEGVQETPWGSSNQGERTWGPCPAQCTPRQWSAWRSQALARLLQRSFSPGTPRSSASTPPEAPALTSWCWAGSGRSLRGSGHQTKIEYQNQKLEEFYVDHWPSCTYTNWSVYPCSSIWNPPWMMKACDQILQHILKTSLSFICISYQPSWQNEYNHIAA